MTSVRDRAHRLATWLALRGPGFFVLHATVAALGSVSRLLLP